MHITFEHDPDDPPPEDSWLGTCSGRQSLA
jgi:hypothetical protein